MRRVVGAIVLTMIAVVLAADPFCCADGCTNDSHLAVTTTPSCCSLCNNGVTVQAGVVFATVVLHAERILVVPETSVLSLLTARIDHPPRLA